MRLALTLGLALLFGGLVGTALAAGAIIAF